MMQKGLSPYDNCKSGANTMATVVKISSSDDSVQGRIAGGPRTIKGKFVGPNPYAPGTEPLNLVDAFGLSASDVVENVQIKSDGGFSGSWDSASNGIVTIYERNLAGVVRTEVGAVDLSGETFFFEATVS